MKIWWVLWVCCWCATDKKSISIRYVGKFCRTRFFCTRNSIKKMSERLRGEFSKLLSSKKNRRANKNIGENLGPQIKGKLRLVHNQKITPYIQKAKRKETFTSPLLPFARLTFITRSIPWPTPETQSSLAHPTPVWAGSEPASWANPCAPTSSKPATPSPSSTAPSPKPSHSSTWGPT